MVRTVPLKKNHEFQRVYKKGRSYAGINIIIYALQNYSGVSRIGITASRKFGKSVKRNRIKRLIRENYRFYEVFLKKGYDYVFVARNNAKMPEFNDIKREMKFLFRKLNVLDQEKWNCWGKY